MENGIIRNCLVNLEKQKRDGVWLEKVECQLVFLVKLKVAF